MTVCEQWKSSHISSISVGMKVVRIHVIYLHSKHYYWMVLQHLWEKSEQIPWMIILKQGTKCKKPEDGSSSQDRQICNRCRLRYEESNHLIKCETCDALIVEFGRGDVARSSQEISRLASHHLWAGRSVIIGPRSLLCWCAGQNEIKSRGIHSLFFFLLSAFLMFVGTADRHSPEKTSVSLIKLN